MPELLISSQWQKKKKYDAHTLCQIQLWLLFDVFPVLRKKDDLQIQRKGFFFLWEPLLTTETQLKLKHWKQIFPRKTPGSLLTRNLSDIHMIIHERP